MRTRSWGTLLLAVCLVFAVQIGVAAEADHTLAIDLVGDDAAPELLESKALYTKRDGTGNNGKKILELMEDYIQKNPQDYNGYMFAAMASFWVCDRTEDEKVKKELGKKGYQYAEKMIEMKPDFAPGYYFYAICLGEYGKGISIPTALFQGLDKKLRSSAGKAATLDPRFEAGGADRTLGRVYFKLPWPKYDAEKSITHLKKSIELCPNKMRTYFYLVETLVKEKDYGEAKKVGNAALAMTPYPTDLWEAGYYGEKIKKVLSGLK